MSTSSVLFIGNYLSRTQGSYAVSEFIANRITEELGIKIIKASHTKNRIIRFIEILWAVSFKIYWLVHIDVFSGNSFLVARLAAAIGKLRKRKVVLTLHGGALHEHYIGREVAFRNLFKNAYVQSPSHFLKEYFEQRKFSVTYSPNPVQLSNFPFKRDQVKPYSLLWVRAFTKIYNPDIPVRVLHNIVQEIPEASLTMIGPDMGLMSQTIELINELKLKDKINIIGQVNNAGLYEYYQTHAVYINTTNYESFGVALVEAASCGIPIVSFDVGEIPYLWSNGENILLCKLGDFEKMTAHVKHIICDLKLQEELSINAKSNADKYSWDRVKPHWFSIFGEQNL